MRLNGWQRIGIVLSALWALFILFVGVSNSLNAGGPFVHYTPSVTITVKRGTLGRCTEVLASSSTAPLSIDEILNEQTDALGEHCLRSHYITGIPDVTRQTPERHEFLAGTFLRWLLVPLLTAWLSVYALIFSVRWISRGFNQKN